MTTINLAIRSHHGGFIGIRNNALVANSDKPEEFFRITFLGSNLVTIQTPEQKYIASNGGGPATEQEILDGKEGSGGRLVIVNELSEKALFRVQLLSGDKLSLVCYDNTVVTVMEDEVVVANRKHYRLGRFEQFRLFTKETPELQSDTNDFLKTIVTNWINLLPA